MSLLATVTLHEIASPLLKNNEHVELIFLGKFPTITPALVIPSLHMGHVHFLTLHEQERTSPRTGAINCR